MTRFRKCAARLRYGGDGGRGRARLRARIVAERSTCHERHLGGMVRSPASLVLRQPRYRPPRSRLPPGSSTQKRQFPRSSVASPKRVGPSPRNGSVCVSALQVDRYGAHSGSNALTDARYSISMEPGLTCADRLGVSLSDLEAADLVVANYALLAFDLDVHMRGLRGRLDLPAVVASEPHDVVQLAAEILALVPRCRSRVQFGVAPRDDPAYCWSLILRNCIRAREIVFEATRERELLYAELNESPHKPVGTESTEAQVIRHDADAFAEFADYITNVRVFVDDFFR